MKKYIDWDAVENTEIDPNETCECTRSKIEGILNFFKRRFATKGHEGTLLLKLMLRDRKNHSG